MSAGDVTLTLPREIAELAAALTRLWPREREIALHSCHMIVKRLLIGQDRFGPWPAKDHRDLKKEALEEAVDLMNYLSAEATEEP
jgi:hypothetical protein